MTPGANQSPHGILVQPLLHSSRQIVVGRARTCLPSPLKITASHGDLNSHLTRGSLGPPDSASQRASRSLQPFFCTAHGRQLLYSTMGRPFLQTCLFPWGIWIPSETRFFGPAPVHNPNGI